MENLSLSDNENTDRESKIYAKKLCSIFFTLDNYFSSFLFCNADKRKDIKLATMMAM